MLPLYIDVPFKKKETPRVVFGIIAATLVWHVVTSLTMSDDQRWKWLALEMRSPGPFQFLTATFTHGNFLHWFGNMLFLMVFGAPLEDRLGPWKFLTLFMVSAAGSFGLELVIYWTVFHGTGELPASRIVGASGAISGIMGLAMARFYFAKVRMADGIFMAFPIFRFRVPLWAYVVFKFSMDFLNMLGPSTGVAHLAHLGGFFTGLACAQFLNLGKESKDELVWSQAKGYMDIGWWPQAQLVLEKLARRLPREGGVLADLAESRYRQWPRQGRPLEAQKKSVLDALERGISLFFAAGRNAEGAQVYRKYIPPLEPGDFSEKIRLMAESVKMQPGDASARPLDAGELGMMNQALAVEMMRAVNQGSFAEAAAKADTLMARKELKEWSPVELQCAAQALLRSGDRRLSEVCEALAQSGDTDRAMWSLEELERTLKGTPKQPWLWELCKRAGRKNPDLETHPAFAALQKRLAAV